MTAKPSAALTIAVAILLSAGCSDTTDAPAASAERPVTGGLAHAHPAGEKLTPEQHQAVARVRNSTARLHDINAARAAGYTEQFPAGCAQSPEGVQGFHYLNPGLVDATIDLLHPELVMYEPQRNGSLQLIGVDYIVPFDLWTAPEPPTLLGVPFMRLEALGVWALHIWAWRPNPSGMFAMWNPKASCAYAQ